MSRKRNASGPLEDSVDLPFVPKHSRASSPSAEGSAMVEDAVHDNRQLAAIPTDNEMASYAPEQEMAEDTFTAAEHADMDERAASNPYLRSLYDVMVQHSTFADATVAFSVGLLQGIVDNCPGMDSRYRSLSKRPSQDLRGLVEDNDWLQKLSRECWEKGERFRRIRLLRILRPAEHLPDPVKKVTIDSWNISFKGDAASLLLHTISEYLGHNANVYSQHASIVNSSGTGKSRMVDELAKSVIVVPMCLREDNTTGFPPADFKLRNWLMRAGDQSTTALGMNAFVSALLTVTLGRLKALATEKGLSINEERLHLDDVGCHEEVIRWQGVLALQFRDIMTTNQTFEKPNEYRQRFYSDVLATADNLITRTQGANLKEDVTPDPHLAGQELAEYVNPNVSKPGKSSLQRPLIVLSFDESHQLTESSSASHWSRFSELRRVLQRLVTLPIFSLFLSTAGKFNLFSPEAMLDKSDRIVNRDLSLLPPITETGFDELAIMSQEGQTLETVTTDEFICHLGRPLFGSQWDAASDKADVRKRIVEYARAKLRCKPLNQEANEDGILACLAVRFALEFRPRTMSQRRVEQSQVERHMRICLCAAPEFEYMTTVAASEPLLAEAAFQETRDPQAKWPGTAYCLAHHLDVSGVDRGDRGELVAMLLLMQARDTAALKAPGHRIIAVQAFMEALLPDDAEAELQSAMPTCSLEGAPKTFAETFKNSHMWFNHFIRVYDYDIINVGELWKVAIRGGAVLCHTNQRGIDILIPFLYHDTVLKRTNMSAVLIQVKNDKSFGLGIQRHLFNAMDPHRVGVFSTKNGQLLLPIIRVVLALGSKRPGWKIAQPPQRRSTRQTKSSAQTTEPSPAKFTSFDFWLAGISSKTFGSVQSDEEERHYRMVLRHSITIPDAYDPRIDRWSSYAHSLATTTTYVRQTMNPASQTGEPFFNKYIKGDNGSVIQLAAEEEDAGIDDDDDDDDDEKE